MVIIIGVLFSGLLHGKRQYTVNIQPGSIQELDGGSDKAALINPCNLCSYYLLAIAAPIIPPPSKVRNLAHLLHSCVCELRLCVLLDKSCRPFTDLKRAERENH